MIEISEKLFLAKPLAKLSHWGKGAKILFGE
jgi:hypothetical protein